MPATEPRTGAGCLMRAEIAEQPEVWRRILDQGLPSVRTAAAAIADHAPRFVLLAARGTSDHAALYGKYLVEVGHQLPAGLVSPSTMTLYGARPDLRDVLIVAISQSGASPDLVHSVRVAKAQGALTVALTNAPDSPLAAEAELHVDVLAGPERSVAATKSYTAQLLVLHLLLSRAEDVDLDQLHRLPAGAEQVLAQDEVIADVAQRYRFAQRLVTTGRGYSYPTAREAALKLMETSYLSAQAFSGADLLHGPLAMIDPQVPVLTVVPEGIAGEAMTPVLPRLRVLGADVFCVGSAAAVASATRGLVLPSGVPGELSPLLEILPFQQLALHTAMARGGNPDAPRGLSKVTETM